MASGFFHACGRRFDPRPAGHCDYSVCFQYAQQPSLFGLASELSGWKLALRLNLVSGEAILINWDGQL
jgi:hypothetical protein